MASVEAASSVTALLPAVTTAAAADSSKSQQFSECGSLNGNAAQELQVNHKIELMLQLFIKEA